jgi:hypothetical protein
MFYEVHLRVVSMTLDDEGGPKAGKPATEKYLIEDTSTEGASARCIEQFDEKRGGEVILVKQTKINAVYTD